ncbi:hypothetical protein [Rhodococcus sp. SGAir0479]|uniref:hypothetical protein n=1 Tax=Rhodococcus sp. SGAir0479 TaxID=2567884 RepID=UPI0020C7E813|nr:hypothetical protein [Rhodococcus sp. SGAir0479]
MRRRCTAFFISIFTALLLLAFSAPAGAAPSFGSLGSLGSSASGSSDDSESYVAIDPTSGTLIASSGFDVTRDGFSFENWGGPSPEHRRGLTPTVMQSLYGDRICARIDAGGCVLTATGEALQADLDDAWSGGHCFGFAALAGLFATDQLDKATTLPSGGEVFDERPSDRLDGLISRYASTQISPPTSDAATAAPVADILGRLEAAWARGDNYVLTLFGDIGGHAITPIALRDLGGGRTGIVVYDNNYPGVEKMVVADAGADRWYYTTALNPADRSYLFVGSPDNPMRLVELPQTNAVHECPICHDAGDDSVLVMIKDNAENRDGTILGWDLDITAPDGSEIEGVDQLQSVNNQQTHLFRVPAGVAFEMTVGDVPVGRSADLDISLYGDGWINEVDGLVLPPGATATVNVDQSQRKLDLQGNFAITPTLMLATEQADWSVAARGTGLRILPGTTLSVERDTDGDFVYALDGVGLPAAMTFDVRRRDGAGDQNVTTGAPVSIPVHSSASVAAHEWNGTSPLDVRVVGNGAERTYPMVPRP